LWTCLKTHTQGNFFNTAVSEMWRRVGLQNCTDVSEELCTFTVKVYDNDGGSKILWHVGSSIFLRDCTLSIHEDSHSHSS
jgi:hypothetical protein